MHSHAERGNEIRPARISRSGVRRVHSHRTSTSIHPGYVLFNRRSSTDIDHGLGNRVRGGDNLGVRLEIPLRGNQIDQLLGQIHVGVFQRT